MSKRKAILSKRWKVSYAPEDKALYKTVANNCKNAIDKFHAAKELALVRNIRVSWKGMRTPLCSTLMVNLLTTRCQDDGVNVTSYVVKYRSWVVAHCMLSSDNATDCESTACGRDKPPGSNVGGRRRGCYHLSAAFRPF